MITQCSTSSSWLVGACWRNCLAPPFSPRAVVFPEATWSQASSHLPSDGKDPPKRPPGRSFVQNQLTGRSVGTQNRGTHSWQMPGIHFYPPGGLFCHTFVTPTGSILIICTRPWSYNWLSASRFVDWYEPINVRCRLVTRTQSMWDLQILSLKVEILTNGWNLSQGRVPSFAPDSV